MGSSVIRRCLSLLHDTSLKLSKVILSKFIPHQPKNKNKKRSLVKTYLKSTALSNQRTDTGYI